MRLASLIMGLFLMSLLAACSENSLGSGTDTGSGEETEEGSSGGFVVSGKLSSVSVSSLGVVKSADSDTVTDIMAVSPETGDVSCKTTEVAESDGTFEIEIDGKRPWFFFFYNRLRSGADMFLAGFQSSLLDTLAPGGSSGTLDLGTVTLDASSDTATSDRSHADILTDLGLDAETADTLGNLDDVAHRYSNPDVDGDGEVDCGDSGKEFQLDFHVRFDMKLGSARATVSDLVGSFLDDSSSLKVDYSSTGVYVSYPKSFSSEDTGSVVFTNSTVTTSEGGTVKAGSSTSKVTTNNFGDFRGFGPNMTSASELPQGEIIYTVNSKPMTFSGVETPSLEDLKAPTGRIFLFLRFDKSEDCTSSCTLSGVSYRWMKKTDTGWKEASATELDLLVADDSGNLSIKVGGSASKTIGIPIPETGVKGTVAWEASNANLEGVTEAEFKGLVTTELCGLGISYDDQLGLRYFQNIDDAAGTCS